MIFHAPEVNMRRLVCILQRVYSRCFSLLRRAIRAAQATRQTGLAI
jgi:hypothetical protein